MTTALRVSVEATIYSDDPEMTAFLAQYCTNCKCFAKIRRESAGLTSVLIQAHPKNMTTILKCLKDLIFTLHEAEMTWSQAAVEKERLDSVTIQESFEESFEEQPLKEPAIEDGFLDKLDDISLGGSATTEHVKKIVRGMFATITDEASFFEVAKQFDWTPPKHISIQRHQQRFDLEVSTLSTMPELMGAVRAKFQTEAPVTTLYRLDDDDQCPVVVTDVKDLQDRLLYYCVSVDEEVPRKPKFTVGLEMEQFFDRLKINRDIGDREISIIRHVFQEQGMPFNLLMETGPSGDLAMTDDRLKSCGIAQMGLRHAILSALNAMHISATHTVTPEMEDFFNCLKTEQGMSDAQVATAKEKLEVQGFNFKQLMCTGKLALTDAELEKYGISQGGLRTAILSLIKINQGSLFSSLPSTLFSKYT